MTKVGEHITLDIIGTTQEYDPSVYENVIRKIAKAAEVTVLEISKYKFEPQGFTILALLAESHISFHTFPEKGIISFDFFTCGKISPSIALDIVKKEFKHKRIVKKEFNRDTRSLYHDIYSSPGLQKSYVVNDVLEDFKSKVGPIVVLNLPLTHLKACQNFPSPTFFRRVWLVFCSLLVFMNSGGRRMIFLNS